MRVCKEERESKEYATFCKHTQKSYDFGALSTAPLGEHRKPVDTEAVQRYGRLFFQGKRSQQLTD